MDGVYSEQATKGLEKLLENTSAENRHNGRPETVRFIDFKNPDNNDFLAVSQFKVNIPGTEKHIIPDIVLFINGLDKHEHIISSFKLPFGKTSENGIDSHTGIIIVQSMLLTGFDAPVEQVIYLDNIIREHNLLQAIARVNRVEKNKYAGFIVDYAGVAKHLREALANFEEKDIDEILDVVKDEGRDMDELAFAKAELDDFLKKYDISDINDIDACVDVLADEEVRNDFLVLFKKFTFAMDKALPKPEALKFVSPLKHYSFISQVARNRYRDEKFSLKDTSKKIRNIIDEFLISLGVDPKIPPLPIFSEKFKAKIREQTSPKARAEELKNAIYEHIDNHCQKDPELHEKFSEKLEKLLNEYKENWEMLARELEELLEEIRRGRQGEETFGFDPKNEMPFFGLLKKEIFGVKNITDLTPDEVNLLVQTTEDILARVKKDLMEVDFWNKSTSRKKLKGFIASQLLISLKNNTAIFNKRIALSQKIMELAYYIAPSNS